MNCFVEHLVLRLHITCPIPRSTAPQLAKCWSSTHASLPLRHQFAIGCRSIAGASRTLTPFSERLILICLWLTLGGAPSWAQQPPGNDIGDRHGNAGGGTAALTSISSGASTTLPMKGLQTATAALF